MFLSQLLNLSDVSHPSFFLDLQGHQVALEELFENSDKIYLSLFQILDLTFMGQLSHSPLAHPLTSFQHCVKTLSLFNFLCL